MSSSIANEFSWLHGFEDSDWLEKRPQFWCCRGIIFYFYFVMNLKSLDLFKTNYSKALELEDELRVVGNNMKSLEISEQEVSRNGTFTFSHKTIELKKKTRDNDFLCSLLSRPSNVKVVTKRPSVILLIASKLWDSVLQPAIVSIGFVLKF